MPTELPEDPSNSSDKKWRFRKPGDQPKEPTVVPIEDPPQEDSEMTITEPSEELETNPIEEPVETEPEDQEDDLIIEEPEEELVEMSTEEEKANLVDTEEPSIEAEKEQILEEKQKQSQQVADLLHQVEEINTKKNALSDQVKDLTEQLDQANTDNAERQEEISQLQEQIDELTVNNKEKSKELKDISAKLVSAEKERRKLGGDLKATKKTAKEREEHLLTQLEAMAERIGKLREVVKKRDKELVALQKDILVKKDIAQDAQTEASQLRTVGIVQREAVQDTTVLRRRVTDLEVELEQLKKALEKDPKYRIYMLVRETGQRTLEELSKILGVGVYEARRRVQELVRAGLLELKDETVTVSRRPK
jgi:chromosome segregation ATPase